jgi:hypothetical protein
MNMETATENTTDPQNGDLLKLRAALAKKKLAVIAATGSVPKEGHNAFNNYDYATASDTFDIVRKALAAGIAFAAEVESVEAYIPKEGSKSVGTRIWMHYTLTDTETGYSETVRWPGDAHDTGDKGLYKAQTNALKYFCFQTFMLPTGLDVEQDDKGADNSAPAGRKPYIPPAQKEPPIEDQIAEALVGPTTMAPKPTTPISKAVKPARPSIQDIAKPVTDSEIRSVAIVVEHIQNKTGRPVDFDKVCQTIFDRYGKFPQQLKGIDECKKFLEGKDVFEKVT